MRVKKGSHRTSSDRDGAGRVLYIFRQGHLRFDVCKLQTTVTVERHLSSNCGRVIQYALPEYGIDDDSEKERLECFRVYAAVFFSSAWMGGFEGH